MNVTIFLRREISWPLNRIQEGINQHYVVMNPKREGTVFTLNGARHGIF